MVVKQNTTGSGSEEEKEKNNSAVPKSTVNSVKSVPPQQI
jgi:hypothetical protein